ncbi:MAG: glycosyltransferase family 2 protein [Thermodesulfobacteriota bacterium]|nr:glycosyltransferase family 2 protein [Thermodesulfobacteriota bacterium]
MEQTVEVSIIIISYNTWHLLGPCIESIREHCGGVAYEIIVVDNASSDGSVEKIRTVYPDVKLIVNNENLGFGRANNQGAAIAGGEYLFLLNADTLLTSPGMRQALDYMRRDGVSMLGPMLLNADGTLQPSFQKENTLNLQLCRIAGMVLRIRRLRKAKTPETGLQAVGFLLGAAMLIRSQDLDGEGLFDERFFFNGEERDLCLRFLKAGKSIFYYPDWRIIHYGGGARHSPFHTLNWIKSTGKLMRKHGTKAHAVTAAILFFLLLLTNSVSCGLKYLVRRDERQKGYARMYSGLLLWHIGLKKESAVLES